MAPEEFLKLQLQRFTTLNLHPSNTDISVAVAGILNFFNCTTACLICAKAECKSLPGGVSSPPAPGCPFFFHLPLHACCLLEDDRGGWCVTAGGLCCLAAVQGFVAGALQAEQPETRQTPQGTFSTLVPRGGVCWRRKGHGEDSPAFCWTICSVLLAQMGFWRKKKKSLKLVRGDYSRQFFTFFEISLPKPTCSLWPKSRT